MNADDTRWTPSGVRLRAHVRRDGDLDWLFLPGGPGIGSESLIELIEAIEVPGTSWLVDLPGDGSNVDAPGSSEDPYAAWPKVFLEAVRAVPNPVVVGHSTGGMYLLSIPELEDAALGMALVSTAPDASWMPAFERMVAQNPIPEVDAATARYEADPTDVNLGAIAIASAPWKFGAATIERGTELLARMPYNGRAVEWSAVNFDTTYAATWWPRRLPTLVLSGSDDRIVAQSLWEDDRYRGANVLHRTAVGGAHFLWIERPDAARAAFHELAGRIRR